ncbi:MAG TPA: ABC transporter permease subunit, partial [Anaerolineaceae bacterium]
MKRHGRWLVPLSILITWLAWESLIRIGHFPAFILPSPGQVFRRFIESVADGSLIRNASFTFVEVALGLLAGSLTATTLGYLLAKSPLLERLISPYLVGSQAIPIVAIAPLLIIWFGPGMFSKVLICALTVFFPVLVNTVVGLRSV